MKRRAGTIGRRVALAFGAFDVFAGLVHHNVGIAEFVLFLFSSCRLIVVGRTALHLLCFLYLL